MYAKFVKRFLDIILSFSAIVLLSPILLLLIIFGAVAMRGNPFFVQVRSGRNERSFNLIKFRTMSNAKDRDGVLLPDSKRLNKYGRILRKLSLDELPELFNIFIGDMSIIGPRPLLPEYLPYYTEEERHRHDVRPGLSGLAQVNGRSFLTWEEIFEYDLQYIQKITFWADISIILKTVETVFFRKNIADVHEAVVSKDGKMQFIVDGQKRMLHQPLNVERAAVVTVENASNK